MIPYGRQSIDESDIAAVTEVLRGDWLTTGPFVEAFERAVTDYTGARFAVAFNSATSALHGACHAAGLGPGDVVHTTPLTFIASVNCARYVGARPALIDIDERTWNIDVDRIGPSVDALVAVHYGGLPVDLAALPHRPRVIVEDASHALGAWTPTGPVGNCAHSDVTVFSFHPVKPITTAEGGVATTNDPELAERMRRFRSHGIDRSPRSNAWEYDAVEVGYNYRLTDVQAALGTSQLRRLDEFIERRNRIAARYRELLADTGIGLPPVAPDGWRHGYHLFPVRVPQRDRVFRRLREEQIGVQVHYVPVHHHSVSSDIARPPGGFPVTEAVYDGLVSLPMFADLTDGEQDTVVRTLRQVLAEAP